MASDEFREHHGKKVGIQYRGTIRWSNAAFDMCLSGDTIATGIEGILERDSEHFVFLRDATLMATSTLFKESDKDLAGRAKSKGNYYVNKGDILQIYVLEEQGNET